MAQLSKEKNSVFHFPNSLSDFYLGAYFTAKKLALRFVAAVWCLSCFIFIQSYSCKLTSVMTLPKLKPLIDSVYDIPKISGLQVVTNRANAVYAAFSVRERAHLVYRLHVE